MVAQHSEYTKYLWIVDFKIVNFMSYEFYLNKIKIKKKNYKYKSDTTSVLEEFWIY